ncbi:MAG: Cache 3/Cache 2 fusion domain-containing protein, partial [Rubrivivax sp.]|nr:Cache 3/Cache 2 fusion domain-containing protein [Rubrivivax sp.]
MTAPAFSPAVSRPLARTLTLGGSAAIVAMTVFVIAAIWLIVSSQQRTTSTRYATSEARAVASTIEAFDAALKDQAAQAFATFRKELAATFELTDEAAGRLTSYGEVLNESTTAVDRFAAEVPGGVATVFVRQGDDWRRISTSLTKENGERAVGTLLDRKHPAYALLAQGQKYVGRATLFGKPYVTVYEPARDAQGRVVGVLFVGIDVSKVQQQLAALVAGSRLYDSGGVYVLDTRGADAALVLHPTLAGKKLGAVLGDGAAAWAER